MGRPTELHQIVPPPHKVGTPEPLKLKLSETYPSLIFRMTFHLQESDNLACNSQPTSLFSTLLTSHHITPSLRNFRPSRRFYCVLAGVKRGTGFG